MTIATTYVATKYQNEFKVFDNVVPYRLSGLKDHW